MAVFPFTKNPPITVFDYWQKVSQHGVTFALFYTELLLGKVKFSRNHVKIIFAVMVTYFLVNYSYTVLLKPVYPLIDFKSGVSLFYTVLSVSLTLVHFFWGLFISQRIASRRKSKEN